MPQVDRDCLVLCNRVTMQATSVTVGILTSFYLIFKQWMYKERMFDASMNFVCTLVTERLNDG